MTTPERSYNMSRIHAKDTKPEMIVRRFLWTHGFRYRLNHPRLPGRPDIVMRKYRTCIFVNGCFWHGHRTEAFLPAPSKGRAADAMIDYDDLQSSECCKVPHTNREFWVRKIVRNKQRDIEVQKRLAEMGWHCITVWECQLKSDKKEKTLESLAFTLNKIYLQDHSVHHKGMKYTLPEENEYAMVAEELQEGALQEN